MSFDPVFAPAAHTLILGTWPSPKSREQGFYYGHPQNRFWPLLAHLLDAPVPQSIPEKKALITNNGLALWDTLASCEITGAADASIRDVVPNDLAGFCARVPIRHVLCNGAVAYRLYTQYAVGCPPAVKLPSTSPANAVCSMERLVQIWGDALRDAAKEERV